MADGRPTDCIERFAEIARLHAAGLMLKRQQLRRSNPDADEQQLDALMLEWRRRADQPVPPRHARADDRFHRDPPSPGR